MADVQANVSAAGVLGDITKTLITDKLETPEVAARPPAPPVDHGTEMMREAFSAALEINKQTNVDVPKLIETVAGLAQHDPPLPVDLRPLTEQVTHLTDRMLDMNNQRSADLSVELRETRQLLNEVLRRERPQAAVQAAPATGLDAIIEQADKFAKLKEVLGFTPPVPDDDAPRRRRRRDDDEDNDDAKKKGIGEMILENLPTILASVTTLGTLVVTGMHNARVMATGEGQTVAPPPQTGILPFQAPPFPGVGVGAAQPQSVPQMQIPQTQAPPAAANPQMELQQRAFAFAAQITPSLLGAFERNETGYDFAELFIKYYGRSGEFGYESLKTSGQQSQDAPFNPLDNAQALARFLAVYPPIWTKIGNDKRLPDFLLQFVSYDEFLRAQDVPNLMRLCIEFEVDNVAEFLTLPDDDDDADADMDMNAHDATGDTPHTNGAIPMPPAGDE